MVKIKTGEDILFWEKQKKLQRIPTKQHINEEWLVTKDNERHEHVPERWKRASYRIWMWSKVNSTRKLKQDNERLSKENKETRKENKEIQEEWMTIINNYGMDGKR